ncbi:MAG: hypothetical protein WBP61_01115 [Nocardioides sp.]
MTAYPPSGYPPGYQPPPKRYRPSAAWFVVGIVSIIVAVVTAVAVFIWLIAGFLDTEATLRTDGQPHQVSVGTDGDRMLWLEDDDTRCVIVDLATGDPIEVRPVGGSFERSDSYGELDGLYRFAPGSGDLEVACSTSPFADIGTDEMVLIGPAPEIDNFVIGIVIAIVVPGLLGLAGLIVLIWTGILWSTRDPRPKGA